MHFPVRVHFLPDDGEEAVNGHGYPELRPHGVLRVAVKRLDFQVLLDPFEKQLHLPALLVKLCDDDDRKVEVVRVEGQDVPCVLVVVLHPA